MFSARMHQALLALIYLAQHAVDSQTTEQIAKATGTSAPTLAKTLCLLKHAGIVKTQRGIRGGVQLARQPHDISVWDVAQALQSVREIQQLAEDPAGWEHRLATVAALAQQVLQSTHLDELVQESELSSPVPGPAIPIVWDQLRSTHRRPP